MPLKTYPFESSCNGRNPKKKEKTLHIEIDQQRNVEAKMWQNLRRAGALYEDTMGIIEHRALLIKRAKENRSRKSREREMPHPSVEQSENQAFDSDPDDEEVEEDDVNVDMDQSGPPPE